MQIQKYNTKIQIQYKYKKQVQYNTKIQYKNTIQKYKYKSTIQKNINAIQCL